VRGAARSVGALRSPRSWRWCRLPASARPRLRHDRNVVFQAATGICSPAAVEVRVARWTGRSCRSEATCRGPVCDLARGAGSLAASTRTEA
jgi:hypothetical protein